LTSIIERRQSRTATPIEPPRSAEILRDVDLVVGADLNPDPFALLLRREDVFPVPGAFHPSLERFSRDFLGRIPVVVRDPVHRRDRVVEVVECDVFGTVVDRLADADAAGVARLAIAVWKASMRF